jgi:hypothetical protein
LGAAGQGTTKLFAPPKGRKARSAVFLFLPEDFQSSDALQSRPTRLMGDFVVSEVFSFSPIAQKRKKLG